jgi:alkylation response protein AidB-like acyl-CoA dehydrogenase
MADRASARTGVVAGLLAAVDRIRPILERGGVQAEAERALPDAVYDAMLDAALFRMLVPGAFGGLELDPIEAYSVVEAVARIDSAAGWNLQISASIGSFAIWLPEAGAKEVYASGPDTLFAGGFFPPGPSLRVDGGWRVSGRSSFASGCHRAQWLVVPVLEIDSESSKFDPHTEDPPSILAVVPRDEVDLVDTWHTVGMRGSFSADVVVDDVFVPDARVAFLEPAHRRAAAFAGAVYGTVPWLGILGESTVSLGIADAAIEKLIDLATRKTPSFGRVKLHDREMAQHHVARARALVDASRASVYAAIRAARDEAELAGRLAEPAKIRCQLAACFAAEASAQAVDLVYEAAGTSSIRVGLGIERHHRDVHVLAQHAAHSYGRYEDVGKMLFGLPPTYFLLDL